MSEHSSLDITRRRTLVEMMAEIERMFDPVHEPLDGQLGGFVYTHYPVNGSSSPMPIHESEFDGELS